MLQTLPSQAHRTAASGAFEKLLAAVEAEHEAHRPGAFEKLEAAVARDKAEAEEAGPGALEKLADAVDAGRTTMDKLVHAIETERPARGHRFSDRLRDAVPDLKPDLRGYPLDGHVELYRRRGIRLDAKA